MGSDFGALYDGLIMTIVKTATLFPDPDMTLSLIKISGLLHEPRHRLKHLSSLKLQTVKDHHSLLLMSTATSRWYKMYRLDDIETDEDLLKHVHNAMCLARGLKLLPELKDTDYLMRSLKNHMPSFFRVLGQEKLAIHINNVFKLNIKNVQIDIFEQFTDLCRAKDGYDLDKLTKRDATNLLVFSNNLREAFYDTYVIEKLLGVLCQQKVLERNENGSIIDLIKKITQLRWKTDFVMDNIERETLARMGRPKVGFKDDPEFYYFVLFFFGKMQDSDNFNRICAAIDAAGGFDDVIKPQNIGQTLFSLAMLRQYDSPLWSKLLGQILAFDNETLKV